ncbi:MAG: triose-phosphate isomerase [Spirochaetota bacterium]
MRRYVVSGNWKMNKTREEAVQLISDVTQRAGDFSRIDVVIFPPYPFLETAARMAGESGIRVGAQDVSAREAGAYTGEVSAAMLRSVGCTHVIIGHSERRAYHQEDDSLINAKIQITLGHGLAPVLCVGETLEQRRSGRTGEVLNAQLVYGLQGIDGDLIGGMVIAYEPVWAIGTGMSASGEQAEEAHRFIRDTVERFAGDRVAGELRIIYGGSVTAVNAPELLAAPNIDGVLVGGASLKAGSFCGIAGAAAGLAG